MGTKLSIDKNVSELDDILKMEHTYYKRIRFENRCPEDIACHLKVKRVVNVSVVEILRAQRKPKTNKIGGDKFESDQDYGILFSPKRVLHSSFDLQKELPKYF